MSTSSTGLYAIAQSEQIESAPVRLSRRLLRYVRFAWLGYALLSVAITALCFGPTYAFYRQMCQGEGCGSGQQLDAAGVLRLQAAGLSLDFYAAYVVAIGLVAVVGSLAFGFILIRSRSGELLPVLFAFTAVALSVVSTPFLLIVALDNPVIHFVYNLQDFFASVALVPLYCMFPDGRFVPRWTAWAAVILGLPALLYFSPDLLGFETHTLSTTTSATTTVLNLTTALAFVVIIVSLFYRYKRVADATQRQQIKWILIFVPLYLLLLVADIGLTIFAPDSILPGAPGWFIGNSVANLIALFFTSIFTMVLLRYHLWDVDLLINRALVYGTLTAFIVGAYVLIVVGLGSLLSAGSSLLLSLPATALVAVAFQPLREQVQRRVNRLMYGERDEPGRILARLGQQIENVITYEKLLPSIVETVARSLKLPFAQIEWASQMEPDNEGAHGHNPPAATGGVAAAVAASYGTPPHTPANLLRIPLVYQSVVVGQLVLAPRARTDRFSPTDQRTLQALAQQIGLAAHAVRLTHDLQRSRERLVTTREEERRRLRRDLHDGLGPQLASQTLTLTAARQLLRTDPDAADSLLAEATKHAQTAITDIRRLVYDLRPPALDDLGLIGALRAQTTQYGAGGVHFTVNVNAPEPLSTLPAAVEVACYRTAQEALTNVVRHANAHHCAITLTLLDDLRLEIVDDGKGLPPDRHAGVGFASMRERAEELGGTCVVETGEGGGVRVIMRLPLAAELSREAKGVV